MDKYEIIDDQIQRGYELILSKKQIGGCDLWLAAWDGIKQLLITGEAADIFELDNKYNFTQFISNYAQDMEMELHNAGLEDNSYHLKRASYCQELLEWCGNKDRLMISNTKRAIAEAYFQYGNKAEAERLFNKWLQEDPDWGWGYIGWSDCYTFFSDNKQYEKAEEILLSGYARDSLRDRINVTERLVSLYKEMNKPEKVNEYEQIFLSLRRLEPKNSPYYKPTPFTAGKKPGRNDPCPCGSGKKYKKCCGSDI